MHQRLFVLLNLAFNLSNLVYKKGLYTILVFTHLNMYRSYGCHQARNPARGRGRGTETLGDYISTP